MTGKRSGALHLPWMSGSGKRGDFMIKDLKLGFQFLKHAYGRKRMNIFAVVPFVVGVPMCVSCMLAAGKLSGGYCFLLGTFVPCQCILSFYASDLVMASPVRRRLEISVYTVMQFAASAVSYLLVLVVGGIVAICSPEHIRNICSQLLLTSVLAAIVSLYAAGSRKHFIASTIALILMFMLFKSPADIEWWLPSLEDGWGLFAGAALKGMALILCSSGLTYLLNLTLYKAPMSKLCQPVDLRKSL